MTAVDQVVEAPRATPAPPPAADSRPIKAVGRPHPWRWVGGAVALAVLGLLVYGAATNDAYHWDLYRKYLLDRRISHGALVTLELTGIATAAGLILGVTLALMRTCANPVLKALAWAYMWLFRGIPLFVQLLFWGLIATIYQHIDIGVPFAVQVAHVDVRDVAPAFALAAIGLSLYAAAALAQTARDALLSVDRAQADAAAALGMTGAQSMRRVVLPQAVRAMLPATGHDVIGLFKATSLVVAIPLASDLLGRASQIGRRIDQPMPLLLVAATWYLAMTSILMIGQGILERRYGRGAQQTAARRARRSRARAAAQAEARAAKSAKQQSKADGKAAAEQQKAAKRQAAEQEKAAKRQAAEQQKAAKREAKGGVDQATPAPAPAAGADQAASAPGPAAGADAAQGADQRPSPDQHAGGAPPAADADAAEPSAVREES